MGSKARWPSSPASAQQFVAAEGHVVLMGRQRKPLLTVAEPSGGLVVAGDASAVDLPTIAFAH